MNEGLAILERHNELMAANRILLWVVAGMTFFNVMVEVAKSMAILKHLQTARDYLQLTKDYSALVSREAGAARREASAAKSAVMDKSDETQQVVSDKAEEIKHEIHKIPNDSWRPGMADRRRPGGGEVETYGPRARVVPVYPQDLPPECRDVPPPKTESSP